MLHTTQFLHAGAASQRPTVFGVVDLGEVIIERVAGLIREKHVERLDGGHALQAEVAEVAAQFAPAGDGPARPR